MPPLLGCLVCRQRRNHAFQVDFRTSNWRGRRDCNRLYGCALRHQVTVERLSRITGGPHPHQARARRYRFGQKSLSPVHIGDDLRYSIEISGGWGTPPQAWRASIGRGGVGTARAIRAGSPPASCEQLLRAGGRRSHCTIAHAAACGPCRIIGLAADSKRMSPHVRRISVRPAKEPQSRRSRFGQGSTSLMK